MIDAVQRAVDTIRDAVPLGAVAAGHYSGIDKLYVVVSIVDDYDRYMDNGVMLHYTDIQVDVWQSDKRPVSEARDVRRALVAMGFTPKNGGGGCEEINQITWHRLTRDYSFAQEAD